MKSYPGALIAQTLLLGGDLENSRRDGTRVAYELHFELAVAGVAGLLPSSLTRLNDTRNL